MKYTKLPAQIWDRLHYTSRNYSDRVIHYHVEYDFQVDARPIKAFAATFLNRAPVLRSSYTDRCFRPCWTVEPYAVDEVVTVKTIVAEEKEKELNAFLLQELEPKSNLQIKMGVFYYAGSTAIGIIVNHMCVDGSDGKFVFKHTIDREMFQKLKSVCRNKNVKLNVLLLAVYAASLHRLDGSEKVTISCAVDLRRYLYDSQNTGLSNQVAWMNCEIRDLKDGMLKTLLATHRCTQKHKEEPWLDMRGIPLLSLCCTILPNVIVRPLIRWGYRGPKIAMSNLGVLDAEKLTFCVHKPVHAFVSGAAKCKPFALLSASTYEERITLSFCMIGNKRDRNTIARFFSHYDDCLAELCEATEISETEEGRECSKE